jgi:DNA polymerase III subunit epsilon
MKRLVIDTETTGLYPETNQILSIGMVLVDVGQPELKFIQEKHILVKHDKYNISETAMQINNIDINEHQKIAVPVPNAIKEVHNFLNNLGLHRTTILGHNVQFDQRFISSMFEDHDHIYPFCPIKEDTRYIWEKLKREGKINPLKNARLGTLADHFGIDYSRAHDAVADCKITAQVYHKMLEL